MGNETTEIIMRQLNSKKTHAATHEVGGGDEIDALKLKNADALERVGHSAKHEIGGSDEINVLNLRNVDTLVTKTGDFLGTWNGAEMTSVEPGLSSAFNAMAKQTEAFVSITQFGAKSDGTDCTSAFNQAIQTGKKVFVPYGTWTCNGIINLSLAPMNSYNIEGLCENSQVKFVGAGAGLYDNYGSQAGRNYHTKNIKNLYFQGDGSNIGFDFRSLQLYAENLLFFGFDTGLKVANGHASKFVNCKFQNNKFDIKFGANANGIEIDNVNIDGHSDTTGACIQFDGNVTSMKVSGIIESSMAPAIWYTANFSGTADIDLYLELVGDQASGTSAIRNDSTNLDTNITYTNGKFQKDSSPRVSGIFQLGVNPVVDKCGVYTEIEGYQSMVISNSILNTYGCQQLKNPVVFSGHNRIGNTWGQSGNFGVSAQIPLDLPNFTDQFTNLNPDPFSISGVSVAASGTNLPTLTQDTTTKIMGKNTTKIAFVSGAVGTSSSNVVYLHKSTSQIYLDPGNIIMVSFIAKANQSGTAQFINTGEIQVSNAILNLDTKWRKFVFIGKNINVAQKYVLPRLHSHDAKTGFEVNITGICVHGNIPNDPISINKFLQGKLMY